MTARLSQGLALCAALLGARQARAQALGPTLLAYQAPPDCPPVGDFQRSVQRRSARIHFVDEGSHERELSIVLSKDGDFTIGELRLIEHNGTLRQRSVRFTTCAEAVEGLALITTVSLDPQALLEAPPPEPPTTPPQPRKPKIKPVAVEAKPPGPEPSKPKHRPPPELEFNPGAEFNAFFNAVPKVAYGPSAFLDGEWDSGHLFAPLFRFSVSNVQSRNVGEQGGQASFALTLIELAGCPIRIGPDVISFRPCAFFGGGLLRAWGTGVDSPIRDRPYWSWGGSGMLLLRLSEVFEIVGDAGVGVTLIRDSFAFGGHRFWTTPAPYLSSGLGLRLLLR